MFGQFFLEEVEPQPCSGLISNKEGLQERDASVLSEDLKVGLEWRSLHENISGLPSFKLGSLS